MKRKVFLKFILALPFILRFNSGGHNKKNIKKTDSSKQKFKIKIKKFTRKSLYEKHNLSG